MNMVFDNRCPLCGKEATNIEKLHEDCLKDYLFEPIKKSSGREVAAKGGAGRNAPTLG